MYIGVKPSSRDIDNAGETIRELSEQVSQQDESASRMASSDNPRLRLLSAIGVRNADEPKAKHDERLLSTLKKIIDETLKKITSPEVKAHDAREKKIQEILEPQLISWLADKDSNNKLPPFDAEKFTYQSDAKSTANFDGSKHPKAISLEIAFSRFTHSTDINSLDITIHDPSQWKLNKFANQDGEVKVSFDMTDRLYKELDSSVLSHICKAIFQDEV